MTRKIYTHATLGLLLLLSGTFYSCRDQHDFDASGSFEAEETILSSETNGVIKQFNVHEGDELRAGEEIGYIDTLQLHLRKKQLLAQIEAVSSRKPEMVVQLAALREQLAAVEREQQRLLNLVRGEAATQKQLDDTETQIKVLKRQIEAQESSLKVSTNTIEKEIKVLQVQIEQIEDQLRKCKIINPINGTVLQKYANTNETTTAGKPLYRIADLSAIILRVYITGNQLPKLRLRQTVNVYTDNGNGSYKETRGVVTWISDKAEFTPKTIQTKDERSNLVYAAKVRLINDGSYKIGMYGEVSFNQAPNTIR